MGSAEGTWTEEMVKDVMLMAVVCAEGGLPSPISEEERAFAVRDLEEKEGVPARAITDFIHRCLDYGWLAFDEPYGYKRQAGGWAVIVDPHGGPRAKMVRPGRRANSVI